MSPARRPAALTSCPRVLARLAAPLREHRGAAAVEFALVAMPLLYLLFAVLELGLILVANVCLSNATLAISRKIRVGAIVAPGQAQTTSNGAQMDLADFKTAVCNALTIVPTATCLGQIQIDVRTQGSFQNQTAPNPLSASNFTTAGFCYYSGTPGSVVQMRFYYLWPVVTPILLSPLVNATSVTAGGSTSSGSFYVLSSAEVFRSEQNAAVSNTGAGC